MLIIPQNENKQGKVFPVSFLHKLANIRSVDLYGNSCTFISKFKKDIMNKLFVIFIFPIFLFSPAIKAQKPVDSLVLNQVYITLLQQPGVSMDSVKYTGDDFQKAGGFAWQRGNGSGWTTGCRLTLRDVTPEEVKKIRKQFQSLSSWQYVNLNQANAAGTIVEATQTVFLYNYVPENKILYFLKASTTGEISVPIHWTKVNFLDATKPNPLAKASETDLRLLGLSRLWAEVKRNFVFMERVKLNWDSLYVANIPLIMQAKDRDECFRILQRMAAQLGDGHTYVFGGHPQSVVPLTTVLIDNRIYIDEVESSSLLKQGVRRGMELVSINGEPALDYGRNRIMPYVSSSTPQWTQHETYEGHALLTAAEKDTLNLAFASAKSHSLKISYVMDSETPDLQAPKPILSFDLKKGNIGYLRIKDFMASDIKQEFDRLYPQILKTSALIIDIRNNPGGNSGNADYILRHLSSDPIKTDSWRSPMYIPAYASWGRKQPWYEAEAEYMSPMEGKVIFDKPVVVLVNRGTFSAAEDFCSVFIGMKRGKLFGTPTGGSTGNGVHVELIPRHTYANICSKHDVMPDGTEFVGIGIQPDVEVKESYQSYFKENEDAAMKEALQYLRSK